MLVVSQPLVNALQQLQQTLRTVVKARTLSHGIQPTMDGAHAAHQVSKMPSRNQSRPEMLNARSTNKTMTEPTMGLLLGMDQVSQEISKPLLKDGMISKD